MFYSDMTINYGPNKFYNIGPSMKLDTGQDFTNKCGNGKYTKKKWNEILCLCLKTWFLKVLNNIWYSLFTTQHFLCADYCLLINILFSNIFLTQHIRVSKLPRHIPTLLCTTLLCDFVSEIKPSSKWLVTKENEH